VLLPFKVTWIFRFMFFLSAEELFGLIFPSLKNF
jgi:hypothetical protein